MTWNTQMHCVGKIQRFLFLKRTVILLQITRCRYIRLACKISNISLDLHRTVTSEICERTELSIKVTKPLQCGSLAISVCLKQQTANPVSNLLLVTATSAQAALPSDRQVDELESPTQPWQLQLASRSNSIYIKISL
jgi:hypothetical protein